MEWCFLKVKSHPHLNQTKLLKTMLLKFFITWNLFYFMKEVEDKNNSVALSQEACVHLQKLRKMCFSLSLPKVRQVKWFYLGWWWWWWWCSDEIRCFLILIRCLGSRTHLSQQPMKQYWGTLKHTWQDVSKLAGICVFRIHHWTLIFQRKEIPSTKNCSICINQREILSMSVCGQHFCWVTILALYVKDRCWQKLIKLNQQSILMCGRMCPVDLLVILIVIINM